MPNPLPLHADSSLKIAFVLDDSLDQPSGVQQYVITVGQWLKRQGHDVHYIASQTNRPDIPNLHILGKNISARFNGNQLRIPLPVSRRAIRHFLAKEDFDILHIQMPFSPWLAGRIIEAANSHTVVIGTFHVVPKSWTVKAASRLLAIWSRPSLRRFDAVISVSTAAQTFANKTFKLKSTVIPNAIWLKQFQSATPFSNKKGRGHFNILFLGKLVPRKGCLLLLKAVLELKQLHDSFTVTICGSGPLLGRLKQFVAIHNLQRLVIFQGFVSENDKPRYYATADITVFPSLGGESFGIVLLEAMASPKSVVIGGDNVGYRTVLGDCPDKVLFDSSNITELTHQLTVLMNDAALRQRITGWQKHHVKQFDIEQVGPKIQHVYVTALRQRRNVR